MPTEKRARQREARTQKLTRDTRTTKRDQRMRTGRTVAILIGLVIVVAAALAIFGGDDDSEPTAATSTTAPSATSSTTDAPEYSDPATAEAVLARTPPTPPGAPASTPADAVEREVLIEGTGDPLEAGGTVVVHYVGVLGDGTTFDSSWPRGEPFTTTIPGQVIDGWNEGLVGVRVGERVRLTIGADKAYGSTARGNIPAGSALMFDIDVVDVRPPSG